MLRRLANGQPNPALVIIKQRAAQQAQVNRLFYSVGQEAAEYELRRVAVESASQYDHYDTTDWVLGDVSDEVEHRGQTQAKPGDVVLLSQDMAGVVSFYSVRIAHNCVAGAGVKPLMGWDEAFAYWRAHQGKPRATWITSPPEDDVDLPSASWVPPVEDEVSADD